MIVNGSSLTPLFSAAILRLQAGYIFTLSLTALGRRAGPGGAQGRGGCAVGEGRSIV